ncbi:phospholipid phosphatase 2 isoform X1 [Procambarus clarkii]|uniref:phospholipid phosphatase 2 isoform X1 n=1 Tax=Procambarus clarkii TaxID=6728 RepID=UPI001E676AA7|nr:phospholipid phosphatase 2-like isoform X1 [Procambarus clarkii]
MTSETTQDEAKKRRLRQREFLQSYKRGIGWSIAAGLTVTLLGIISPSHTVVSCDDPSIRMAYHYDTISVGMLLCISLFVPFFVILAIEWIMPSSQLVLGSSPFRLGLRRSWGYTTDLFVGGLFMFFINDVVKTVVGEARPHFWDTCRPNITSVQCQQQYISVTWHDCTNPYGLSHPKLVDSMKSFPSGHASISVFSSIFMIVYIKQRLWNAFSMLVAPWLQLIWAIWTVVCCQSRVWDNRHHWWDVLCGGLLGVFGAFVTLHYFSNWFIREDDIDKPISRDAPFCRQEDHASRFTRTSIKRLISNTSETDNHSDLRHDDRELRDINGTP